MLLVCVFLGHQATGERARAACGASEPCNAGKGWCRVQAHHPLTAQQPPAPHCTHPAKDGGNDRGQPCRRQLLLPLVPGVEGDALRVLAHAHLQGRPAGTVRQLATAGQPLAYNSTMSGTHHRRCSDGRLYDRVLVPACRPDMQPAPQVSPQAGEHSSCRRPGLCKPCPWPSTWLTRSKCPPRQQARALAPAQTAGRPLSAAPSR